MMFLVRPEDFVVGPFSRFDADELLLDSCWSLYCLDAQNQEAIFVKTPPEIDLTDAPFLFQSQFLHAQHILRIDFESFHSLASEIQPSGDKILFIHSVGRCGSTLLSKVFGCIPAICSLAEPDPITQITQWRGMRLLPESQLQELCESSTRFGCKRWPNRKNDRFWVFKYRAQCIGVADWLINAFPSAKQLFIHRKPLSWLDSVFQAFVDEQRYRDASFMALFEKVWGEYFPLIRDNHIPGKPMNVSKTWTYVWISVMERLVQLKAEGYMFHELDYENLKLNPEPILRCIFQYCGVEITDWRPLRDCLQNDSQAGSTIAREQIKNNRRQFRENELREAVELLKNRGFATELS